ncbi:fungal-specific transcription factor domain-containing protein [Dactylonectria macrodidyma]|uniref:Fungal-specific transcription factor domain-containing protein n=1 Tax=Dactylonectria macrodidyma TaxID=307937 RepID=A0A9P9EA71_9HYPO|nr:fungal-specific transcription factor domain-containing protein [Dactylonectria macrodidyma]
MTTEPQDDTTQTILVATADDENGGETVDATAERAKRRSVDEQTKGTSPGPESPERPVKKMKRGKYISRACTSCQTRKIKCEGGEPCAQCVARKRQCVSAPRGTQTRQDQKSWTTGSEADMSSFTTGNNVSNHELLSRLVEVERRLNVMQSPIQDAAKYRAPHHPHAHGGMPGEDFPTPKSTELDSVLEVDGQTFAGEISMSPAFQDVDEGPVNAASKSLPNIPAGPPAAPGDKGSRKVRGWLESVLNQHGVVANEEEWRRYLAIFMDEIHILYPILHRPTVWATFDELWEYSALWSMSNSADREQKRMSVALVCFCLALGRCSVSTRMTDANGVHSAGWSLYSVGLALMQDTMEMSNAAAKSLVTLQILVLRVLYLFRLDATQRAVRIHALLVSNAHIVGLHRQSTYDKMPVFWSQMYCRTWWSIYVLDRRLAIESGRPYLIQDSNIDTALPLELGDDWLSRFSKTSHTTQDLKRETALEIASEPITPMPYLTAMVRFSRVVSKVWELMYGIKGQNSSSSAMVEYADSVLCNLLETVPKDLSFDPRISPDLQFGTRLRWQVKQTMLLFSCSTFLRLLIRRPFLTNKPPAGRTEDDELESVSLCASLAASILSAHENIQDSALKYCFPFSHYLTSATMVMIGLVTREPKLKRRYKDLILAATRSLNMYCHRIWVSGKTMRWVRKLTLIVQRTLNEEVIEGRDIQSTSNLQDAAGQQSAPNSDLGLTRPSPMEAVPMTHGERTGQTGEFSNDVTMGSSGFDRRGSLVSEPGPMLPRRQIAQSDPTSDIWAMMETGVDNPTPELPEWAMLDFNFEAIINGDGMNPRSSVDGLETITEDGKMIAERVGGGMGMGFDIEQSIFGPLESTGMFSIGMDVDKAVLNLCNPSSGGY